VSLKKADEAMAFNRCDEQGPTLDRVVGSGSVNVSRDSRQGAGRIIRNVDTRVDHEVQRKHVGQCRRTLLVRCVAVTCQHSSPLQTEEAKRTLVRVKATW
jgi:hypothetical protein